MSEWARQDVSRRQAWAAPGGSHDRIIGLLRVALPMAIGVLAAFLVMAPLFDVGEMSFVLDKRKVDVAVERLRIERAQYRGTDTRGRPFQLTAGSAVQKSSAERIVQLQMLAAQLQMEDGPARLRANRGRYDLDAEQVAIDGPIAFRAASGYTLDTRDATVDLRNRRLRGTGAVTGTTPMGRFSGDRMEADLESRTVKLSGNAHLRIVPKRSNRP
ncbi:MULTISPECIES: LPS export ABC transporter periplasmic protein LptC [unclassified Sphingomonas]|uniref:LPS export ABC transporter periplasmic protein LptC n=1 Tax=unclassified Sphingomonas TaxID=196159 RepID=UPI000831DFFC|nr:MULTISPECIES: LPS export ABC transporter periplasmic protein LptC [unclassified Sphingomonas]MCH4893441.1 LPS export ABC transporter periplasmic protein LptC [Sphingomonas sp. SFZ2018-12]